MDIRIYSHRLSENTPSNKTVILVPDNFFRQVFENTGKRGDLILEYPVSEVVYSRSDYNGYRWYTNWFHPHKERLTQPLIEEIDQFMNALFEMTEFQTLDSMKKMCYSSAEKTGSDTEFNLYTETEHFYVWLRLITRFRDYNLYVHFYQKDSIV